MKKTVFDKIFKPLIIVMVSGAFLSACSEENTGFDKKEYDISKEGNNSLIASLKFVNSRYELLITGTGASRDFSDDRKTPWYSISKKIGSVSLEEGVTSIGDNIFNKLSLTSYILPKSLLEIKDTSFKDGTNIYSYADNNITGGSNCNIYYYSEDVPTDSSKTYWHYVKDQIVLWKEIKTLFIGNSFTFYSDIPTLTQNIARDLGYSFSSDSVTIGSHRLDQFADSNDEQGKIVEEKLKNNQYDFVILQEQSTRPLTNYSSFLSGARALQQKINSTQKNCSIRLYSTWGFKEQADAMNITIPEMEKQIRDKYDEAAKALGVGVHYVGKGFTTCYTDYPDINLYYSDNKHPSYLGAYLSALIHVGSMLNVDVRNTTFVGEIENQEIAKTLQNVAYSTVFNK